MNNSIVVYWSPATFYPDNESWNLLYSDPVSLSEDLMNRSISKSQIRMCPALKKSLSNVFSFNSTINDYINLTDIDLKKIDKEILDYSLIPNIESKLFLRKSRESSYSDFINLEYNMSWLFFSEEPLLAEFTAPYFPATTPCPNAMMSLGEFDIGRWFRPFNLDYHIPYNAKAFNINVNDPFYFVKFKTDKKIVFKKFTLNKRLLEIAMEQASSSKRYGFGKNLIQKYRMFENSQMRQTILKEIKKELI